MNKPLIITKERIINATPAEIWKIITNPEYFNEWMYVPGKAVDEKHFGLGSIIQWTNEDDIVYLEGEVIVWLPNKKLVIALQDISWEEIVPQGTVSYQFHLTEMEQGTLVKFYLGDLAIDPEGETWYNSYQESDEIGAIEQMLLTDKSLRKN